MLTTVTYSRAVHCKAMTSQQLCNCHITHICNTHVKSNSFAAVNHWTVHPETVTAGRAAAAAHPIVRTSASLSFGSAPSSPTAATAVQAAAVMRASPAVTNLTIRRNLVLVLSPSSGVSGLSPYVFYIYLFYFVYFFDVHSITE